MAMFLQCKNIVEWPNMPRKAKDGPTMQFSVSLPLQALALLEQLIPLGLHGNSRAEVARALILHRLEELTISGLVKPLIENKKQEE